MPSWSWSSVDMPNKGAPVRGRGTAFSRISKNLEIIDTSVSWSGCELTSTLTRARIMARGRIKRITTVPLRGNVAGTSWAHLESGDGDPETKFLIRPWPVPNRLSRPSSPGIGICTLDRGAPKPSQCVWCLEVLTEEGGFHGFRANLTQILIHVLILEQADELGAEFRRLGAGHIFADNDNFNGLVSKPITLI
jgi:hypothetical protein